MVLVPLTRAELDGRVALPSVEVSATVSLVLTTFQFASTAFTVTLNAVPAVCAFGVPVLPVMLPGAATSPGASNCSLTNAPALTLMEELIPGVLAPSLISLAVTVRVPVLFNVILKVRLPAASAALGGKVALLSLDVMPTVSVTVLTRFQLASTALTATLN